MQAGQRFEDPSQIDFLGTWEDVRLGGYDPQAMVKENEMGRRVGRGACSRARVSSERSLLTGVMLSPSCAAVYERLDRRLL